MTVKEPAKRLRVAIIGGGPGGLSTSIALSQIPNVDVTLYEQAKVLREVGAGISIGQNTWKVLELLGVADSLTSGHETATILQMNGKTSEEINRLERPPPPAGKRPNIRTQRTKLQSALLSHVKPGVIQLSRKLQSIHENGSEGVELRFQDGTVATADLVVGADGIRSVVRDSAWPSYTLSFTGTTIWRALLPLPSLTAISPLFGTTAWWHGPTTHIYISPVGDGLGEIAARSWQDPAVHSASKVSWGVPVSGAHVASHFGEYRPELRAAVAAAPEENWREFAAFSGPELDTLTAWEGKVVLVGDSSHALSGAFGSGAGFAMEDGWVLARALEYYRNDARLALGLFERIRLPYYRRMYEYLATEGRRRKEEVERLGEGAGYDELTRVKIIKAGEGMGWIYENDIGRVWREVVEGLERSWDLG